MAFAAIQKTFLARHLGGRDQYRLPEGMRRLGEITAEPRTVVLARHGKCREKTGQYD